MKNLLARASAGVLTQLASSRTLLAFDFDGTLSPLVMRREGAELRPRTRALFRRLCERYPCAVISGRSRADVCARLEGLAVKYVVGNHGLEPGRALTKWARQMARLRPLLARALRDWPGLELEDKRYSLSLHYRRSRSKGGARQAILAAVRALPEAVRVVPGKDVVNLVPLEAPNKADALLRLRARERAEVTLYVGDDVTDEDVFELDQPGLQRVRVGASRASAAAFFLVNQRAIDLLLARLVASRES